MVRIDYLNNLTIAGRTNQIVFRNDRTAVPHCLT
ncbi:hypothetical protein SDC9_211703 [bioreactor metagenome]|uniref:Uncharacterized protein n=1 Tax=bioreactor metagenome TaxID=1076179 RepID=A0A645JKI4_9ZZZZ